MLRQVAAGVLVHESECIQSNAVAVVSDAGVLLIDPGITREELRTIAHDLRDLGRSVVAGFSTHPDWDHVLWHPELGSAPRYGTARGAAYIAEFLSSADWEAQLADGLPPEFADDIPRELLGLITGLPPGTAQIPWDGPAVRIIEHRAHAPGHAALLIEEGRTLVAGDMLSDVLVPMLDLRGADDPIEDYLAALGMIEDAAAGAEIVIPGHGSVGGADELRRRIALDRAYVVALREGTDVRDPRLGSPKPGWEWVSFVHEGQLARLART